MRPPAPGVDTAHWIKPNHVTRLPRRHVIIDTEAVRLYRPGFETQTFRLAVASFDHQDRKHAEPAPTEYARFTAPEDLWAWVDGCAKPGTRTVVAAHNLAYDLRIGQAFTWLPKLGWELDVIRLDAGQTWAQWRGERGTLTMIDTVSWFGRALEDVGRAVGAGKLPLPADDDPDEAWFARCRQDVDILRGAWLRVLDWLEADGHGNWKPTGAGQGWASFRHNHLTHPVLHHGVDKVAKFEREAAWTGRCEAWRWGKLARGPWFEMDYRSAYTQVAHDCDVPVKLIGRISPSEARRFLTGVDGRSALLRCRVTTETPTAPTRGDKGILWPVGEFESWLWDVEAAQVEADGGKLDIVEAWQYRSAPALRQWAAWVLDVLADDGRNVDPVVRLVVKGWSRSVVGRFGSRWSQWARYGEAHGADVILSTLVDVDQGATRRLLMLGGESFVEEDPTDAPDGAVHVMSWIMAACRVRLLTAMRVAGLDNLAYVDTDGLLVNETGLEALQSAALPGLRVKSAWRHCEVLGPRQLVLDGKLRAAGVPARAVRVGAQSWRADIWRSLASSLAQGETGAVVVSDRTWNLKGVDNRRVHLKGGKTEAVRAVRSIS